MIAIRAAKVATVAAIALFASLVTFGNLTDYNTNFVFVEHVLSMDTIFPFSHQVPGDHQSCASSSGLRARHRGGGGHSGAVLDRRGSARSPALRRCRCVQSRQALCCRGLDAWFPALAGRL